MLDPEATLDQAYLNRGEESPFISDLYLGGGLQELTLLIRPLEDEEEDRGWRGRAPRDSARFRLRV